MLWSFLGSKSDTRLLGLFCGAVVFGLGFVACLTTGIVSSLLGIFGTHVSEVGAGLKTAKVYVKEAESVVKAHILGSLVDSAEEIVFGSFFKLWDALLQSEDLNCCEPWSFCWVVISWCWASL